MEDKIEDFQILSELEKNYYMVSGDKVVVGHMDREGGSSITHLLVKDFMKAEKVFMAKAKINGKNAIIGGFIFANPKKDVFQ
jgi:hypothetical protein